MPDNGWAEVSEVLQFICCLLALLISRRVALRCSTLHCCTVAAFLAFESPLVLMLVSASSQWHSWLLRTAPGTGFFFFLQYFHKHCSCYCCGGRSRTMVLP